jgi:CRP/FNR family transcriptional regulator
MLIDSFASGKHQAFATAFEFRPTLSGLFARRPVERLEPGSALFWQGDPATHVFEVAKGALRIVRVTSDGGRVIIGFRFAGDLVGLGARDWHCHSAEAVIPTRTRRLSRLGFADEIDNEPTLREQLVTVLRDEMAAARDQVMLLSRKSAEERVCGFLVLMMARRCRNPVAGGILELPISRLDIADYLGLTIETVSRAMTRLRVLGVAIQAGRYGISVQQPGRLAELAGILRKTSPTFNQADPECPIPQLGDLRETDSSMRS